MDPAWPLSQLSTLSHPNSQRSLLVFSVWCSLFTVSLSLLLSHTQHTFNHSPHLTRFVHRYALYIARYFRLCIQLTYSTTTVDSLYLSLLATVPLVFVVMSGSEDEYDDEDAQYGDENDAQYDEEVDVNDEQPQQGEQDEQEEYDDQEGNTAGAGGGGEQQPGDEGVEQEAQGDTGSYGVNSQGNHYCTRGDSEASGGAYHYSNTDGSYYYQNSNGSTYYNSGTGHSTYTAPADNPRVGN